ncbi:MAG: Phenylacetate-coenzyme A ligase [bacterium ADurb.Bin243]|nr:MAG: Phenylacetate-coenzyme A ligase [bacterium ADurb.Bin243]
MSDAYIFGEIIKNFEPYPEKFSEIIKQAAGKKKKLAAAPINDIINVLDSVSRAWADKGYHLRKIAWDYLKEQTGYSDEMLEAGFQTISYICSKKILNERLASELNCEHAFEKLDRLSYDKKSGGMIKLNPLGNILHVSASNVFISAVDSLVSGFITKNVNFLKLSHADILFPVLFARSVQEMDVNSVMADCFSVFYYRGGDEKTEKIFKESMDAVVVWGGAQAVAAWRAGVSIKTRLIEYGPKMSFAFADLNTVKTISELETLCDKIASDISMWEQTACSSPQNVYIVESAAHKAEEFCKFLFYALKRKESSLPPKTLSLDEQIEILKFREKAYSKYIAGDNTRIYYDGDSMPCSVVLSDNSDCEPSVLFRNIIVKAVSGISDFYEAVSGVGFYLQAVSIAIDGSQIPGAAEKLHSLGASRVLSPGRHSEPLAGASHDSKYLLNDLVRYSMLEIQDEEQVPLLLNNIPQAAEISMIKNILKNAYYETEYYRTVIPPQILELSGEEFIAAFKKLPALGKKEIYENCLPDSTGIISGGGLEKAYIFASGGSTGEAKFSVYSNDELEYVTDVLADIYRAAGIRPKHRTANLFIAGGLWTSFIVANMALEKIGVTNLALGGNTDFPTTLKFFKKLRPDAVVGLPSIILKFAEYCEKEKADIKIGLILYGGEHMRTPAREYLKKVLGAEEIVSAGYAAVDCGPVGFQCSHLSGGALHHVLSGYQHAEFITPEGRDAKPGEAGEIIVTNLNRSRMPVIRFRTGDMGAPLDYECPCGRKNPVFELLGRCDDILVAGGANLTPRDFEDAIAKNPQLSSIFQLIALTKNGFDALELFLELKEGAALNSEQTAALKEKIIGDLKAGSFKVKTMLESGWLSSFEIFIQPAGKIERVERTGKVVNIKDMRK